MIDKSYYHRPPNLPDRISAGGVVCRFDSDNGNLLVAVVCEKGQSHFVLPKGGVEENETLEEAARREIGEEAGIHQLNYIQKLGVLERLSFRKTRWTTTHIFLFMTDQVDFRPTDVKHAYQPEWWPIDNIGVMLWPEQKNLLEEKSMDIKQAVESYRKRKSHDSK